MNEEKQIITFEEIFKSKKEPENTYSGRDFQHKKI